MELAEEPPRLLWNYSTSARGGAGDDSKLLYKLHDESVRCSAFVQEGFFLFALGFF